MHQELIDELSSFARRNNLRFNYHFDDEQKTYTFRFQDQERTWGYFREFTQEELDSCNTSTVYFANEIISTLKKKISNIY